MNIGELMLWILYAAITIVCLALCPLLLVGAVIIVALWLFIRMLFD